jgi:hypothetical protein
VQQGLWLPAVGDSRNRRPLRSELGYGDCPSFRHLAMCKPRGCTGAPASPAAWIMPPNRCLSAHTSALERCDLMLSMLPLLISRTGSEWLTPAGFGAGK